MSGSPRNQIQVLYLVGLFLLCSTELRGKQTDFLPFMVLRNSRNLYKIYYSKKFSLFWKNIEILSNLAYLIELFLVVYCYTVFKAIRPISTGNNSQCVLKNLFLLFILLFYLIVIIMNNIVSCSIFGLICHARLTFGA